MRGSAAGVLGAFPEGGQPQEDVLGDGLLGRCQDPVDRLGGLSDGLAHPSGIPVTSAGQCPASTALPSGRQGVGQQRQCPGLLTQIRQDGLDQAGLQHQASVLGRAGDRLPPLLDGHRGHQQLVVLQRGGQRGVVRTAGVEIRADTQHHRGPALGVGGEGSQGIKKALPFGVVVAEGEDFLQLVDGPQ